MRVAKSSKRFSRQLVVQSAILAAVGMTAGRSHAASTDTWVGPYTDTNNTTPTNWATASNWSISNAGQTLPAGTTTGVAPTDSLVITENDSNTYQVNFDNGSLSPGPSSYWFTSLNAGNANASGSVAFNLVQGSVIGISGAINFSNGSMNVGTDNTSYVGTITAYGNVTFSNNSALNVSSSAIFAASNASTQSVTFSSGSALNISAASTGSAGTATFSSSTLNISGGSLFQTSAGAIFGGATQATQTLVYVTTGGGSQSSLSVGGGNSDFAIGGSGYATAYVDAGSKLTSAGIESSSADDFYGGLKIGEALSSSSSAVSGILNTAGNVTNSGRLYIGVMQASHNGTGLATEFGSTGLVSMTSGTWNNAGNVLIGLDASSAGNGTATGAVPIFGLAHGELDISGGNFNVAAGKQVYVGASSATGILNVSGGALNASAGIQVGTTFDMLANTFGAGVNGAAGAVPGTGTFLLSGNGFVTATNLTIGASSSVNISGGTLAVTNLIANSGSIVIASGGTVTLSSLIANSGSMVNLGAANVSFTGSNPSITLNGGGVSLSGNYSNVAMNLNASTNFQGLANGGNQQFGTLNFSGDTSVTSTYAGNGTDVLTFSGFTRTIGVTGNFVSSGGSNGVSNSIVLTAQASGFISPGIFFNGGNYAWYDPAGFVRGITYGTDPGSVTTGATTSVAGNYVQTTGAVSAETTNTFTTLAITGPFNFGLAGGAILTVDGIDKSGGGASIIAGGTGIQAGTNAEMVIRSDSAADNLTISSNILANGSNVLTKTGAGSLTLSGSNSYTGGTIVTDGTLVIGSSSGLPSTGSVTINPSGTLDLNSQSATVGGLTLAGGNFVNTGGGGSLALNGDVVSLTSPATFTSGITLSPATATGAVTRTFNVSGSNSISDLTLSGLISKGGASNVTLLKTGSGTLTLSGANSASSFNTLQVVKGTLCIDGSTGTLTDGQVNLTLGSTTSAGTFKFDNTTSTGPVANSMGMLSFASGDGTVNSVRTAAQNVAMTFTGISRAPGATGNIVVTGGTNGTSNKISIAGQPAGFIDPGIFFNGGNFAWNDLSGFVRGINYGTDAGSASSGAVTTGVSPTAGSYLQLTGAVTNQSTQPTGLTLNALLLSGSAPGLAVGSHNVIQYLNSVDKTGGGSAGTLTTSGTGVPLTPNSNLIIRTDTTADALTVSWTFEGNGNSGLVKTGAGTLTIGTNANLYTGDTIINGGTLTFNGTTADTSDLINSTLNYNNFGGTLTFGSNQITSFGGLKGSQNLSLVNNNGVGESLILGSSLDNQSTTYSGVLSGSGNLTKAGTGTLTLAGANTFTGPTNISSGTLELTGTGSLASQVLTLGSASNPGTVAFKLDAGQGGGNFTSGTTVTNYSSASISASGMTGNLALGALNRGVGSAIDFGVPTGSGSITTTSSNTASTILGAWATVNQTDWATVSSGKITALASYSSTFSAGADVDAPTGTSTNPGTLSINSLRFNNVGSYTIGDSGSGDTLTVAAGGILVTPNVGANSVTISTANLTSGTTELIVDQADTVAIVTIGSNITGAAGLTITGAGTLILSGTSTYTGATALVSGTLAINSDAAVNHGAGGFQASSGVLRFNNYTSTLNFGNLPNLKLGAASGAMSTLSGIINGSSGVNFSGPGTLILAGTNNYSGATIVTAGTLKAGSTSAFGNNSTSVVSLANMAGVTLDITGFNNKIGSLVGGGTLGGNVTLGASTLSIGGDESSAYYPNSPVYAGVISGTGGITKITAGGGTYSPGVLTLTGANTYTGQTGLAGGVLAIGADSAVNNGVGGFSFAGGTLLFTGYTSKLSFSNLANLNLGSANGLVSSTLTGAITGTSKLTYVGPGVLNLAPSPSTANTYTGGTNISAGTLAISADAAIDGGNSLSFGAGTLQFNNYASSLSFAGIANLKLGAATGAASQLSGSITGTTPFTFAGPGTLELTSTGNTYSGGTSIVGGTLQLLSNSTTVGSATATLTVNPGGTLDLNGTSQTIGGLTGTTGTGVVLNNDSGTNAVLTINNTAAATFGGGIVNNTTGTGTVSLVKLGSAAQTLSRSDNTYSGTTTINAGSLSAGGANVFSPNSQVSLANVAGATLSLANFANTIGSLTGGGSTGGNISLGSGTLSIGSDNSSPAAYAGVISGTGGVTKIGTGTLTLSGVSAYTGATQVTGGMLEISGTGALAASAAVTINGSGGAASMKYDTRTATGVVPVTVGSLNLIAGGTLTMANTGSAATAGNTTNHPNRMELVTSSLTNAGNIDLGGNDMIIHGTASSAVTTLASVTNQLAGGLNGGTWAGTANGSIRSSAAAADPFHLSALGSASGLTSFDSGTVAATDVVLKFTYYGDATLDGRVDSSDYSRIDTGYLGNLTGWGNGDFNYDGVINGSDYTLIDNAFNNQGTSLAAEIGNPSAVATAEVAGGTSAVPEPASLGLIGFGAVALLGRRRGQQHQ